MRKLRKILCCMILLSVMTGLSFTGLVGCGDRSGGLGDRKDIEFTVVENEDLPAELKKLIDTKKDKTLRMTYTTKDYTYVVAGYGTKETSGYSIKVNGVYTSNDNLYADIDLLGPGKDEQVNEVATTPYIVIKIEKREEPVVFKM
ncbi:MAG: protease complex subunit PrcB family protein [Lachnospira sp.]